MNIKNNDSILIIISQLAQIVLTDPINMTGATIFHWSDYVVSAVSLSVGPLFTLYFLFTGGRQKTSDEYLLGDESLSTFAVGVSIMASSVNAVFLLGGTAEVYFR